MLDWFSRSLPDWAETALGPALDEHNLKLFGLLSLGLFLLSLLALPWVIARIPADYFSSSRKPPEISPGRRVLYAVVRNAIGVVLLALGIVMLLLPGQGLLTILIGLMCLDFPGKRRLEQRFVASPKVLRALNAVRKRAGRPPLDLGPQS